MKSRNGKSQRREDQRRASQKTEEPGARKGRKVAKRFVFLMICGLGGSKSRLAKAAGAEPCGQTWKMRAVVARNTWKSKCTKHTKVGPLLENEMSKKCTPLWREAPAEAKMYKTHHSRITFGSWEVQKVHAIVARSTFWSQKCEKSCFFSDARWRGSGKMHVAWQAQYKRHVHQRC